jgi:hypothetical protein
MLLDSSRPGRAEHQWRKIPPDPVAMQFDFAAERFGEPFKRLLWTLRDLLLMWFGRRHCRRFELARRCGRAIGVVTPRDTSGLG